MHNTLFFDRPYYVASAATANRLASGNEPGYSVMLLTKREAGVAFSVNIGLVKCHANIYDYNPSNLFAGARLV